MSEKIMEIENLTHRKGNLTVITGPMFSEKSNELISSLKKIELYQHKKIAAIKPNIENRFSEDEIVSRTGLKMHCISFSKEESTKNIIDTIPSDCDTIGIDEIQFFGDFMYNAILCWLEKGKDVFVSGLDLDLLGNPFKITSSLLALSDRTIKKHAYCSKCGQEAKYSQLISDGKEVVEIDSVIKVGNSEYEPRCKNCFVMKRESSSCF